MFGPNHYVPILRWKQAERFALKYLRDEDRRRITPLIELTPTIFRSRKSAGREPMPLDPANVLQRQAKNLLEACGNFPFFLDLHHVTAEVPRMRGRVHALEYLAEIGRSYKLKLVPVVGLSGTKEYLASVAGVVKNDQRGICLRITPAETHHAGFTKTIRDFLKSLHLEAESIHLLIDYQANNPLEPTLQSLLETIPHLDGWQTVSVASGAFPPDLQGFQPGNRKIPRSDWIAWKNAVSNRNNPLRKPTFSDYTIQYGLYKEPVEGCNPSVSIRYTLDQEWLIMRGEAVRGRTACNQNELRPGREQWNAHAQLLCDDGTLYYGETFSWGDAFILERSVKTENHGSPEIWLRAGINHHMTVVSRQIASLAVA